MKEIAEILKLSPKILTGLMISSGIILFLPDDIAIKVFLNDFRQQYGFGIGLAFIVSTSILFSYFIWVIFNKIKKEYLSYNLRKIRCEFIKELDDDEKEILRNFMMSNNKTFRLSMNSQITTKLQNYKVISPAGNTHIVGYDMVIPYFIQPWAYDELKKHPEYLVE